MNTTVSATSSDRSGWRPRPSSGPTPREAGPKVKRFTCTTRCLAFIWILILVGCEGCRDEKPYTPFGVTSVLPPRPTASAPELASGAHSRPGQAHRKAAHTSKGARRFRGADQEIESPNGRVFEQVLEWDFDSDGRADIAAWTLAELNADGQLPPGELWLYPATGDSRRVLEFPGFVPTGRDCRHKVALSSASNRMLSVDVTAECNPPRLERSPTRALAVVDPFSAEPLRFGLRVADPAPGENLTLALTAKDEDADGRDDFHLSAALDQGSPESQVQADLLWLDRAAGVSRDSRQPARSLEAVLSREAVRAKARKNAPSSIARVASVRRLLSTLCAEGKVPRLFDWEGAPLRCTNLGTVIDRAATVEVTAAIALSNLPEALAALTRDGWYFGNTSLRQRATLVQEIERKVDRVPAARITLAARPRLTGEPGYSPLSFQNDGSLLLQTDFGLFRLAPNGAREELVPGEEPAPWPLEVVTRGGARLLSVSYSCDRSEVALLLSDAPTQVTPLLAPRPGVCGGQRFQEGFRPMAVSAGDAVEILIGGTRVGPPSGSPPGGARSADGRWLAIPSELGLLIQGSSTELWKINGWKGASRCVVANGARRAACVREGKAELYLKSEQKSEAPP